MIIDMFYACLQDYTLRTIIIGTSLFGITSAIVGSFAFIKKQSLLGDVISHATLPGLAIAFFYTQHKQPLLLLLGGGLSAFLGIMFMNLIIKNTMLKKDAALGIILSVFFGFGLVLLTWLQQKPNAQQGMLIKYIFGNAATIMQEDIYLIASVSFFVCFMLALFFKECVLVSFNPVYAKTVGYPVFLIDALLLFLTVLCIIIGLQLVGVVLMSTILVAPAAAARQWTTHFHKMVLLAACFSFCACLSGSLVSAHIEQLPTGPTIVIFASIIVFISLVCSPKRPLFKKVKQHASD